MIGAEPDGLNINEGCGSTHLDALIAAVIAHGADAGIAHDGDADRCLAVTSDGQVVDGDQILAILAVELKEAQRLTGDTVVTTVMSNLGFRRAMEDAGIRVVETAVGDRYVLEAMQAGGYVLGGEQSGHIIMLEHATTGDGVLTALHLLWAAARRGLALGELAKVMQKFPASAHQRSRRRQVPGEFLAGARCGRGRRRGRARRKRPGSHPPEWDRTRGPGDGRGGRAGAGPADSTTACRGRPRQSWLTRRCGAAHRVDRRTVLPRGDPEPRRWAAVTGSARSTAAVRNRERSLPLRPGSRQQAGLRSAMAPDIRSRDHQDGMPVTGLEPLDAGHNRHAVVMVGARA